MRWEESGYDSGSWSRRGVEDEPCPDERSVALPELASVLQVAAIEEKRATGSSQAVHPVDRQVSDERRTRSGTVALPELRANCKKELSSDGGRLGHGAGDWSDHRRSGRRSITL